ncbi:MAG: hypothetical protein M3O30_05905 [Planctomycetota bacterium]|nr:hypothetical protein [Planctomycetota bacterium]
MQRVTVCLFLLLGTVGCSTFTPAPPPRTIEENQLFGPVAMKLDTFSKIKDLTGTGKPDGIEALVEFDDRFGDRTKAAGTIFFELFLYRPGFPDPRGARLVNPWSSSLAEYGDQKAHWERASGAYTFRLACDQLAWDQNYVLTATFESGGGQRFFSQIVLKGSAGNQ